MRLRSGSKAKSGTWEDTGATGAGITTTVLLRRLRYFPHRMSDAELQALTA